MTAETSLLPNRTELPDATHAPANAESDEGDLLLRVTGLMTAEEFHPFVVRTARRLALRGWVLHEPSGTLIRAVGDEARLARLVRALFDGAPPSVRIRSMDPELITAETPAVGATFAALVAEAVTLPVPPPLQHVA